MERKLIKQGGGGYTIYLPKKWIDKRKLKPGDNVNVIETDTSLVVGSPVKGKKEIIIKITDENKKDIRIILTHVYRRGFDKITITNINDRLFDEIKVIAKDYLLGFEVTEKKEKECSIENISEPTEAKYSVLLRRIFLIIKETQNVMIRDFEKNKFTNLKEIEDLMKQQDKFVIFCKRLLINQKYEKDPIIGWELLSFLMYIEHAHFYLYKYASENKIEKNNEVINLLKNLKEYFDLYYNAYYKKDITFTHKIQNLKSKFQYGKAFELIKKGKNPIISSYLRELFRMMQIGTSPIISELVDKEINIQ